ncbi:MAG: hypothetical protein ACE5WD_10035 [Candidatus Aminicenantia bacterium]
MKKLNVFFLSIVLIFAISSHGLKAEHMDLSIYSGVVTDDSFSFKPFYWTIGLNMDIHFNNLIMLSPECYMITHNFNYFFLAPAVLLNLNFDFFIVGAGLTKWFSIGESSDFSTDIGLKVNAGINGDNLRLMVFIVTSFDNFFAKGMAVGATLGFSF